MPTVLLLVWLETSCRHFSELCLQCSEVIQYDPHNETQPSFEKYGFKMKLMIDVLVGATVVAPHQLPFVFTVILRYEPYDTPDNFTIE